MIAPSLITAPTAISMPVDIERVRGAASYYTNGKSSVVIFAQGTCVFPPLGANAVSHSLSLMKELPAKLSFVVREMDDRNFVVAFSEKVFAIVFKDDFDAMAAQVAHEIAQSTASEAVLGAPGKPTEHFHMGVVARTRLLKDSENPVVTASIGTTRA